MNFPKELKYTKSHEWVKIEGDIATEGISDFAQEELSDIVYLELPEIGTKVEAGKAFGTIEAVKAVSDLVAAVSGEIVEVNEELVNAPETINSDPYGAGWIIKVKMSNPDEANSLLSAEEYEKFVQEEH
ncbi:glycine cleavage system protein GcvH [candidate division TA06 bacterium]|uniref:Glycine cleavage system H protein n=1 Tax=candidate division TA06 bacterium TaxID=2250710 RepID=A0A660S4U0_UNCT6|nr:MAG: glycine cleavage system protein GcvH [candidate division TA06 bacterium]